MTKKINNTIIAAVIVSLFVTGVNCKNSLTPPVDETRPGSRDYIWTVDTLKPPLGDIINMYGLWGSSENDVWAVGHGDVSYNTVWHYDGKSWNNYGNRLSSNHFSVFGFAQNNVWMVDAPNGEEIWFYNGVQWELFGSYPITGQSLALQSVWGDGPNNVYATGFTTTLDNQSHVVVLHYDGKGWKYCDIPTFSNVSVNSIRRDAQTGKYYLGGTQYGLNGDIYKVLEYDGQRQITEIYSGPVGSRNIDLINGHIYFSGGQQIWIYINNRFELWNDLSPSNIKIGAIWGRNEKDIFAQGNDGTEYGIAHFNGTDWKMLYSPNSPTHTYVNNLAVFDSTIFILMNDVSHTWIVRGKLKPQN
jgi:hypothetical protein